MALRRRYVVYKSNRKYSYFAHLEHAIKCAKFESLVCYCVYVYDRLTDSWVGWFAIHDAEFTYSPAWLKLNGED